MKNLLILSALFLLVACGGDPQNGSTDTSDENSKTTPTVQVNTTSSSEVEPEVGTPPVENPSSNNEIQRSVDNADQKSSELAANKKSTNEKVASTIVKTAPKKVKVEENVAATKIVKKRKANGEVVITEIPAQQAPSTVPVTEEKVTPKPVKVETPAPIPPEKFSHDMLDELLRKHVDSYGKVNYAQFKKDEAKLDTYLALLERTAIEGDWSRSKKMAFWINAYNANTVKLILKNYPVKSITDLHGGKPWDVKWIKLNNQTLSLNNIENDILRPKYKDARIHFAVNCAAKSCPPLLNQAWTEFNLESKFEQQAVNFINNKNYNSISEKNIEVSKIFDWYGEDFGNLVDFLNKYSKTKISSKAKISYREYDWALNN